MGLELFLKSSIDLRGVEVEYKSKVEFEGIEEAGSESIIERELETIVAPLNTLQMEKQREIKERAFFFSYLCGLTRDLEILRTKSSVLVLVIASFVSLSEIICFLFSFSDIFPSTQREA